MPTMSADRAEADMTIFGINFRNDPFDTSSWLAFLGRFVNIGRMTVVVITFANLWWRST
jgi:hypothetical protein